MFLSDHWFVCVYVKTHFKDLKLNSRMVYKIHAI